MKKKVLTILLMLIMAVLCVLVFLACSGIESDKDKKPADTHVHSFINYTYNNDATCGADGTETAKCENCDENDTRISQEHLKTGEHVYGVYTYNNDATCGADGTETAKCENCDENDTRIKTETATGEHLFKNYVYNNDATCAEDGTETAKCETCQAVDTRLCQNYLKTGMHNYDENVCTVCYDISPYAPATDGLKYKAITVNNGNTTIAYSVTGVGASKPFANNKYIKIPSTYNYLPVTRIDSNAFYGFNCQSVALSIPDSVTYIGDLAFSEWRNLKKLVIPDSVTYIGLLAFSDCKSLTSLSIGSGVTHIDCAFQACTNLLSVTMKQGAKDIGGLTFEGCYNLMTIDLPDSITYIGGHAFDNTAYYNDKSNWENGVLYIGKHLIAAENLGSYSVKQGTLTIASQAFSRCSGLTRITIPNSVKSIGSGAFRGCVSLKSMTLPFVGGHANVTTADESTLFGYLFGKTSYSGGTSTRQYYSYNNYITYYIPMSLKSVVITGGNILYGSFYGCSSLTSIDIPNSITNIGNYAFYGCSSLTSIDIPNSITNIGNYAFYGCSSLTSIDIPNNVTGIGGSAFYACRSLTSIEIPNSVTSIGNYAFSGCSELTIYCVAKSKPSGWGYYWNDSNCPVIWDYKKSSNNG